MGCVINKIELENGESSKLFQELSEHMPPSLALENYLELTNNASKYKKIYGENSQGEVNAPNFLEAPKFKLEEFKSYQEQIDVMEALTDEFINELKGEAETSSLTTLSGINLEGLTNDPQVIPRVLQKVKDKITNEVAQNNYPKEMSRLLLNSAERLRSYVGVAGVLGPLGRRLMNYGIFIDVSKKEITEEHDEYYDKLEEEEGDSEDARVEYDRIYSMSILQMNPSNSTLEQLKLYLKGIKKVDNSYKFDPANPAAITYESSLVGSERNARYDTLISHLYSTLVGAQTVADVRSRIADAAKNIPQLAPIYKDLINEKSVTIDKVGEYLKLSTALFTLAKQDYNMSSFVEMVNGNVVLTNSNSETNASLRSNLWSNSATIVRENIEGNEAKLKSAKTFSTSKNVERDLNNTTIVNKVKVRYPGGAALAKAATILGNAGFTGITKEVLKEMTSKIEKNPLLLSKSNNVVATSSIINTLITKLAIPTFEGKDVFPAGKNAGESKLIKLLSSTVEAASTDINIGAFLGGNNTVVHPFNLGSEAQDIFSRIKGRHGNLAEDMQPFMESPMYKDTQLMKIFTAPDGVAYNMFEISTLDTLVNNAKGKGVNYGNFSTPDALVSRMNAFFHPKAGDNFFQAFSPTQGDRGALELATVPKMNLKANTTQGEIAGPVFDSKQVIESAEVKEWVFNQVKAELTRINEVQGAKYIPNYTENGVRFNLFTALNEGFDPTTVNKRNINKLARELAPKAEQQFHDSIYDDVQYYLDEGVIEKYKDGYIQSKQSKKLFSQKVGNKRGILTKAEIETFLANNFIYNHELTLFRVGDPAFYKQGSDSQQKVDINKRFALPFTPGTKLAVGEGTGMPENFKLLVVNEPKITSELAEVLQAITGNKKAYNSTEIGDGSGIMSIDRYRRTMLSQGRHNDEMLKLLDAHEKWRPGQPVPTSSEHMSVQKAFFFGLQNINDVFGPFALKYGVMPALPAFFEATDGNTKNGKPKFPGLAEISKALNSGRVDEVVLPSAVKVGLRDTVSLDELSTATPIELPNRSVRHPQVVTSKLKDSELFGSQMRKLVIGNFNAEAPLFFTDDAGNEVKVDNPALALDAYNAAISNIVHEEGNKVFKKFIAEDGQANIPKIISEVLQSADTSISQNADYFHEGLQTFTEDGGTTLPLYYPTNKFRIDNTVNSNFRNAVNRLKLPGHSAVQISSFATAAETSAGEISLASDLKFTTFADLNGNRIEGADALALAKKMRNATPEELAELSSKYKTAPAEVRLSPNYFIKTIQKAAMDRAKTDKKIVEKAKTLSKKYAVSKTHEITLFRASKNKYIQQAYEKEYKRMVRRITNDDGSFDLAAIKAAGLDEVVLYRIPTQGKNSMLLAKILEFLPPTSGNTIQLPGEIVDQSGADFDIDKVYVEVSPFKLKGGGLQKTSYMTDGQIDVASKEQASAFIVDFHKSILRSPAYMKELLTPNGTETLTELAKDRDSAIDSLLPSVKTQETFRVNNKAGKDLISISSISSVMHAVAPHIGAQFNTSTILKGVNPQEAQSIKLGSRMNIEGTALISDEIAEIQNAALDNAKDPLLGKLNIDNFTASTALFLVSAGHGLKFATDVLNAPAVKKLTSIYPKYSRLHSEQLATKKAFAEVRKLLGIKKREGLKLYNSKTFSAESAEALLTQNSKSDHALALAAFEDFQGLGTKLSKFQRTMSIDSKGVPPSVAKLFEVYTEMASIPGTKAYRREKGNDPILKDYDKSNKKSSSSISVTSSYYDKSHLSTMEVNTLHVPLEVNKVITPSASLLMQKVIFKAKEALGYVPENTQLNLLSSFDSYLAMNSSSHHEMQTSMSKAISKGDYMYLTDKTSHKSVYSLLNTYRDYVKKFNLTENQFTSKLKLTNVDGRAYVSFNNLTSRSLPGDVKADMMHFISELMYSDSSLERSLAEALTKYAMVHYGFSTSKNSYMQYIPPHAHEEYLKSDKDPGQSMPEFFRSMEDVYNELEDVELSTFVVDDYITQYVQNNAHKLDLTTFYESSRDALEGTNWREEIERDALDEKYERPKFVKVFNQSKDFDIYEYVGASYEKLERRGIPNLVVEYHKGPSLYNDSSSSNSMEAVGAKAKMSVANRAAVESIQKEVLTYTEATSKVPGLNSAKDRKSAMAYLADVKRVLDIEVGLQKADLEKMGAVMDAAVTNADVIHKFKTKKAKEAGTKLNSNAYNTIFVKTYKEMAEEILNESYQGIMNKLC